MEKEDVAILETLRADARTTITEISNQTGMAVTSIHRRLKNIKRKAIKKYTAIIDFEKIGYPIRANVLMNINEEGIKELEKMHCINTMTVMEGKFNCYIGAIFKTIDDYSEFRERISSISEDNETFYTTSAKKQESFLSLQQPAT